MWCDSSCAYVPFASHCITPDAYAFVYVCVWHAWCLHATPILCDNRAYIRSPVSVNTLHCAVFPTYSHFHKQNSTTHMTQTTRQVCVSRALVKCSRCFAHFRFLCVTDPFCGGKECLACRSRAGLFPAISLSKTEACNAKLLSLSCPAASAHNPQLLYRGAD
jgi:hypothetical protein